MDEAEDHAETGEEEESVADSVCQSSNQNVEGVASATSAPAGAIRPIDRGVVHQICSGQVCFRLCATYSHPLMAPGRANPRHRRQGVA